jgi:replicative DNA helicase
MQLDNLDLQVLKTLFTNRKYAIEFVNECDTSLFSPDALRFANLITNYIRTYKELPTKNILIDKVKSNDTLSDYVNSILSQIDATESNPQEFPYRLQLIKDRFAQKQLTNLQTSLVIDKGVSRHITDIQKTIADIQQLSRYKTFESRTLKEALPSFVDKYKAKQNNPTLEVGIRTGYQFFDLATNGLKPADLVLITAESGSGKSLMLANMAVQVWLQGNDPLTSNSFQPGKNILYFSLEMPFEECMMRLVSRLSMVASRKIENATLNKEELKRVKAALNFIDKYPYHFKIIDIADACANNIEMIVSDNEFQIDCLAVDYLGLMKPNKDTEGQDWLRQTEVSYELRAIGRKHNIPILSAVQLNRKSSGKDSEAIGLSRLARSNGIATNATVVIQIEQRQEEQSYPDLAFHIIKNRRGPKTKGNLLKNLPCACLTDIPIEKLAEYDTYFPNVEDISEEIEDIEDLELESQEG